MNNQVLLHARKTSYMTVEYSGLLFTINKLGGEMYFVSCYDHAPGTDHAILNNQRRFADLATAEQYVLRELRSLVQMMGA